MVGHRFAEALRSRDTDGLRRIVIVGQESLPAYDRVGLSACVDDWDANALALPGNEFHDDDLVELRLGERVERIDRTALTSTGAVIAYDTLVLANWSYPFVPPVPGHELPQCFVYRTIEDLDRIRAAAQAGGSGAGGVVIGGGLLGLETAPRCARGTSRVMRPAPTRRPRSRIPNASTSARPSSRTNSGNVCRSGGRCGSSCAYASVTYAARYKGEDLTGIGGARGDDDGLEVHLSRLSAVSTELSRAAVDQRQLGNIR
jgi:nitrite reductase (NADH) large subunit